MMSENRGEGSLEDLESVHTWKINILNLNLTLTNQEFMTPWKITMEHNNGGLENDDFPFQTR